MMRTISALTVMVALTAGIASAGAAPRSRFVPAPVGYGEGLVIPVDSPVRLLRIGKDNSASFSGRFVLSGTFTYGCRFECTPPLTDDQLVLAIVPDAAIAKRLPHWKVRNGKQEIIITRQGRLAQAIANPREHAGLRSGKIHEVQGHVAVVVDDFVAAIECDSASYSARFVAMAGAPQRKTVKPAGDYRC